MIEFGPRRGPVRKVMRKVDGRHGRGAAAALAIPMGMAPIHNPANKNEWVGCPRQLLNAR
jgi:hypothetical protein